MKTNGNENSIFSSHDDLVEEMEIESLLFLLTKWICPFSV